MLDSYLCEWVWRQRHRNLDLFDQILADIAAYWPPLVVEYFISMYSFYFEIWKSKVDRKTEVSFFFGGGDNRQVPFNL